MRPGVLPALVMVILVTALIAGCGQAAYTGKPETVRLGIYKGELSALFMIAQAEQYYERYGVDVRMKFYQAGALALQGLIDGEVDMATAAEFPFVSQSFTKKDLRIVASTSTSDTFRLVGRVDRGVRGVAGLVGKRIGITAGTQGEYFLGIALTLNDIPHSEVTEIDMNPSDLEKALADGRVDAVVAFDPVAYQLHKDIPGTVDVSIQGGQEFYWLLLSKQPFLAAHPAAAERMVQALVNAQEFLDENPARAKAIVRQNLDLSRAYMDYVWKFAHFDVALEQPMVLALETEAGWAVENHLYGAVAVPNYLDFIYFDALEKVNPGAVTIIH